MEGKKWKKWWEGFFPALSLLPTPPCFFLLTFLCTSSSIWMPEQTILWGWFSDLREQSWDHCTVSHILSLTDQIILRLIIDVKSLSNYWYARTTSSFLVSSCNSGAFVRSSVCKILLLDSLGQFLFIACFDGRHHLNAHLVDLHSLLEPKISRQTFK